MVLSSISFFLSLSMSQLRGIDSNCSFDVRFGNYSQLLKYIIPILEGASISCGNDDVMYAFVEYIAWCLGLDWFGILIMYLGSHSCFGL